MLSFQDWLLAITATFSKEDLFIDVRFVDDSDLTPEAVGQLRSSGLLQADDLKDNRQTEDIARALDMLDKVSKLNASYQAAIELPTVRTPSQLKTLYEPLMDTDGVDIIDQPYHSPKSFDLPDFSKKRLLSLVRSAQACMSSCSVFQCLIRLLLVILNRPYSLSQLTQKSRQGLISKR